MQIEQLVGLDEKWEKGTNLHHALLLANRHFRKHPNAQPVLLIVTDGEPTSHLESDGEVFFDYPPHPLTIALAVRELDDSRRLGARTTFFRLGDDPGLARFVDAMAQRAGAASSRPSSTTWAPRSSAPTWARAAPRHGRCPTAVATATGSAAEGSGSATEFLALLAHSGLPQGWRSRGQPDG